MIELLLFAVLYSLAHEVDIKIVKKQNLRIYTQVIINLCRELQWTLEHAQVLFA